MGQVGIAGRLVGEAAVISRESPSGVLHPTHWNMVRRFGDRHGLSLSISRCRT
jgi:hypothetical protein